MVSYDDSVALVKTRLGFFPNHPEIFQCHPIANLKTLSSVSHVKDRHETALNHF